MSRSGATRTRLYTKLRGQVEAGADHVVVRVIGVGPGESALPRWRLPAGPLLPSKAA